MESELRRPLTDDERILLADARRNHAAPWKVARRWWTWGHGGAKAPRLYATRREAQQSLDTFIRVLAEADRERIEAEYALARRPAPRCEDDRVLRAETEDGALIVICAACLERNCKRGAA